VRVEVGTSNGLEDKPRSVSKVQAPTQVRSKSDTPCVTNKCHRRPRRPRPRRCCSESVGGRLQINKCGHNSCLRDESGAFDSSLSPPAIPCVLFECLTPSERHDVPTSDKLGRDTRIKNHKENRKMKLPTLGRGG
jgi:hypothetical protein